MARILITDDDDAIRRSLELHYRAKGHEIVTAANASEALDVVDADPPNVVISDIRMPGEDGLSLLKRIRVSHPLLSGLIWVVI